MAAGKYPRAIGTDNLEVPKALILILIGLAAVIDRIVPIIASGHW